MSKLPATPVKTTNRSSDQKTSKWLIKEDNNNINSKFSKRQNARTFIVWYKRMIDESRENLALYLSDDVILEWFGKTIKGRKKVTAFLRYDMQCSRHDFTTIESIEKVSTRQERLSRKEGTVVASPLHSPEICNSGVERHGKRRLLRSNCNSPEWAEGCGPEDELKCTERKRFKSSHLESATFKKLKLCTKQNDSVKVGDNDSEVHNKGDCVLGKSVKRKCLSVTPPNVEVGQGDCLPSTSGTDSDRSHDTLNAQLPKLAVECTGYIEFIKTRNNRSVDSAKWERKCKVQISYSEDPLNVGEYIIWALQYHDESKCRRNLLAAFEEAAKEELNVTKT